MAEPTIAELVERVEALEEENSRLKALSTPPALEEQSVIETPMRDAFEVRSELTDAVVGCHDESGLAHEECDRLNDECRREGIKHLGKPMHYEVIPVRVVDEAAFREVRIEALKAAIGETEDERARDALSAELEQVEAEQHA